MTEVQLIESVNELKELCSDQDIECFIRLGGGIKSSKSISFDTVNKKWFIHHNIDDSFEELNEDELESHTNIVEAIDKKAFFMYI